MASTFAGRILLDPRTEAANCQRFGFPVDWLPKVNRYECPLGHKSGTGHVLMVRGDLDAIDVNAPADLIFSDGTNRAPLKRLHIVQTSCITPGAPNDKKAVHLVELADHRRYCRLFPLNAAYNLAKTPTGNYAEETATDETTAYTWREVWAMIWEALPADFAGQTPALPSDPQGEPGRFDYYGWRAIDAAGHFLARCGFMLALDLLTDTFSVVKPGDTQYRLAQYEAGAMRFRLFDIEPVNVGFGQLPANVDVYFRREPTTAYGDSPWEVKTVAAPAPARPGEAGTEIIYDDLPATYQGETLTNDDELEDRANDRAEQFFRQRRDFLSTNYLKVYSGAQSVFVPGSQVESVAWQDAGGAGNVKTTVKRMMARDPMADWPKQPEQPWRLVALTESQTSGDTPPTDYGDVKVKQWNADSDDQEDIVDGWTAPATASVSLLVGFKEGRPVYVPAGGGGISFVSACSGPIPSTANSSSSDIPTIYGGGYSPYSFTVPSTGTYLLMIRLIIGFDGALSAGAVVIFNAATEHRILLPATSGVDQTELALWEYFSATAGDNYTFNILNGSGRTISGTALFMFEKLN